MASVADVVGGVILPGIQFTTGALSGTTAAAGVLSGNPICFVNSTTNNGTLTTRTAAQMIADSGLANGQSWWIVICNSGATNALTLGAGSNVTVAGTATIAAVTMRLFIAQVNATSTGITITGFGISMTATALALGV